MSRRVALLLCLTLALLTIRPAASQEYRPTASQDPSASRDEGTQRSTFRLQDGSTLVVKQNSGKSIDLSLVSAEGSLTTKKLDSAQIKSMIGNTVQMTPDKGGDTSSLCDEALEKCRAYVSQLKEENSRLRAELDACKKGNT